MTNKLFFYAIGAIVGLFAITKTAEVVAESKKYDEERAQSTVLMNRSEEDKRKEAEYEKSKKSMHEAWGKRDEFLNNAWNEAREKFHYNKIHSEAEAEYQKTVNDYIQSSGYNASMNAIEQRSKEELKSYLDFIRYDSEMKKLKNKIQEEKDTYERIKRTSKINGGDTWEAAKKAAKKSRDEKIKGFEKAIDSLNEMVDEKKKAITESTSSEKDTLRKQLIDVKVKAGKVRNDKIAKLNDDLNSYVEIKREEYDNAPPEFDSIMDSYRANEALHNTLMRSEKKAAKELITSFTKIDSLGYYLAKRGMKGWQVFTLGMIPMILVVIGSVKYVSCVYDLANTVAKYR